MAEELHLAIVPYIPIVVIIISVLGMGGFAVWNRQRGNVEVKAPSVAEAWEQAASANAQLDIERRLRRWFESAFWRLVDSFGGYAKRAQIELTQQEKNALEAQPPSV